MYFFHKCIWIWNLNWSESEFAWIWFLPIDKLKRKYFPKNLWRKITTKKCLNKFPTQESLKKHSQPKDWKEESTTQKMSEDILSETSLTTCIYPRTIWRGIRIPKKIQQRPVSKKKIGRDITTTNSLKRTLYKAIFERNHHKKHEKIHQKYLMRNLYQKIVEGKILPKNIHEENFSTKQSSVKGNSLPNKLLIESLFQTNSKRNNLPKNIWGNMPTQTYSEDESLRTQCLKRNLSPEKNETIFLPQYYPNRNFYQTNPSRNMFLGQNDFEEKPLPNCLLKRHFPSQKTLEKWTKNLWRDTLYRKKWKELSPTKPFEEKSSPFFGEKSLPNKFQKKHLPKNLWRTTSAKK